MSLVWLITGASGGFGLGLALDALKAGHQVIAAMRNPTRAADSAKSIEDAGGKVLQLDVTESQESIRTKIQVAEGIYGKIDVLVNNAGYSILGPFEAFTEKQVVDNFSTNVFGAMFTSQAVLPGMRSRRSGTIVNISSVAGHDATPTCSLYAGTKFALEGMSEALSKEVKEFGISVLLVEPGAFRTNFLTSMELGGDGEFETYKGTIVEQALGRFKAANGRQPGDPAKAVRAIIDVVTGQGEAGALKGKLLRLVLGGDAHQRILTKTQKVQEELEASKAITLATDFDN